MITTEPKEVRPGCELIEVSPEMLAAWLREGDTVLVDVREDFEHAAERIEGAEHVPLPSLDPEQLRARYGAKRVVFQCRTGRRSAEAANRFGADGESAFHLSGGLEAWKQTGRPTQRSAGAPRVDVMRQVQMTAGTLILAGVLLGVLVHPGFLGLSGFVGAGLIFAGATGWCGMAKLLALMPWNRVTPCAPCEG